MTPYELKHLSDFVRASIEYKLSSSVIEDQVICSDLGDITFNRPLDVVIEVLDGICVEYEDKGWHCLYQKIISLNNRMIFIIKRTPFERVAYGIRDGIVTPIKYKYFVDYGLCLSKEEAETGLERYNDIISQRSKEEPKRTILRIILDCLFK